MPYLFILYLFSALFSVSSLFASLQVIDGASGPGTVNLDSQGENDGVSFINQNVNQNTLFVPGGSTVNSANNSMGIQTSINGLGNVTFGGGSGASSTVKGKVGDQTPLYIGTLNVGGASVTFEAGVHCANVDYSGNGVIFLEDHLDLSPGGSVTFNGTSGLLNLSGNTIVNGNIGPYPMQGGGLLKMEPGSIINGNVGISDITMKKTKTEAAVINGNLCAIMITLRSTDISGPSMVVQGDLILNTSLNTEKNFLSVQGNSFFQGNVLINMNQSLTGALVVEQSNTINGSVDLIYHFFSNPRPTRFALSYPVVSAASGTSGATINLINDPDWRMTFYGVNTNGSIFIVNQPQTGPVQPPVNSGCPPWLQGLEGGCNDEVMLQLCPIADDYPGSDLDYVERQLSEPTWEEYTYDVYQIYPAQSLRGVAQESFNTTRQFQKIFLKHFDRDRCLCRRSLVDLSCAPCDQKEEVKIWTDGFGYFGRQSNHSAGLGYDANTWGTLLAMDAPAATGLRVGVAAGYASTFIKNGHFVVPLPKTNTTHTDNYEATAYVSYKRSAWFADGGLSYGWNRYHGKRYIAFNELNRTAHASYHGQEYSAFATTGYQYCLKHWEITPVGSAIYSRVHINSYHESGAQTLNLKIKAQNYDYLESSLGVKIAYLFETCFGSYVPELHGFWNYQWLDRQVKIRASFSELGALAGYFTQTAPKTDRNQWTIGSSFTCYPGSHFTILFDYDFEFGDSYYDHQLFAEVAYQF